MVKHLKLTPEQADLILDLKVRQLSRLDKSSMESKLKEQLAFLKKLQAWLKKPKVKIAEDMDRVIEAIHKDQKFEAAKDRSMKVN